MNFCVINVKCFSVFFVLILTLVFSGRSLCKHVQPCLAERGEAESPLQRDGPDGREDVQDGQAPPGRHQVSRLDKAVDAECWMH